MPLPSASRSPLAAALLGLAASALSGTAMADPPHNPFRVVLLRFRLQDQPPLYTGDALRTAATEIGSYFEEASYHNQQVQVTFADPLALADRATYWSACKDSSGNPLFCPTAGLFTDAMATASIANGGPIDWSAVDGIMFLAPFCQGDNSPGAVTFAYPTSFAPFTTVNRNFVYSLLYECPVSCPVKHASPGPSGVYWGSWAHELGHMLEQATGEILLPAWQGHPSGYASGYDLLDSSYPSSPGAYSVISTKFMTGTKQVFQGWLPDFNVSVVPAPAGFVSTSFPLRAISETPYVTFHPQVIKLPITDSVYYLVESRLRVGVDARPTTLYQGGLMDEGVRISRIDESADPPVTPINYCDTLPGGCSGGPTCPNARCLPGDQPASAFGPECWPFRLFHAGDRYDDVGNQIHVLVGAQTDDGFQVTVQRGPLSAIADPTIVARPTLPPLSGATSAGLPAHQIWIDASCNGYAADVGAAGLRFGDPAKATGFAVGDELCLGHENRFYARIANHGNAAAAGVRVHFDVRDPSFLNPDCGDQDQQCPQGWFEVGAVDAQGFPELGQLAPGQETVVYATWTPPAQLKEGTLSPFFSPGVRVRIDPVDNEISYGNNVAAWGLARVQAVVGGAGRTTVAATPLSFQAMLGGQYYLGVVGNLPGGIAVSTANQQSLSAVFPLEVGDLFTLPLVYTVDAARLARGANRFLTSVILSTDVPTPDPYAIANGPHSDGDIGPVAAVGLAIDVVGPSEIVLQATVGDDDDHRRNGRLQVHGRLKPSHRGAVLALDYTDPAGRPATRLLRSDDDGDFEVRLQAAPDSTVRALWSGDSDHAPAAAGPIVPRRDR